LLGRPHHQARPVQAVVHPGPQRAAVHPAEGAHMSPAVSTAKKYYGKYRAQVLNNVDPLQIGRVQVSVPGVSGLAPRRWAMPCLPISGINNGVFAVPTIGAGVWVEFEQGNPDHPIWVGGYWGVIAETPTLAKTVPPAVPGITMQTLTLNGVVINDTPG